MSKDIIAYTEEEAQSLGRSLAKMGVQGFGPETGMELLTVVNSVDIMRENHKHDLTPEMKELLEQFNQRILDICAVMGGFQSQVVEDAQAAVDKLNKWEER